MLKVIDKKVRDTFVSKYNQMFEKYKQVISQKSEENSENKIGEENYKEFNHIKNKLFNEVEIIKQMLFSTVNTSYIIKTTDGSDTYAIRKWFKKGKGSRFSFLRNNNFLQFNYFLSVEKQEAIAILLDQFRDFTAHGNKARWFENTSLDYNKIYVDDLIIFLFLVTKNRSTVKKNH